MIYGVGAAKTGTKSLSAMFLSPARVAHEAEYAALLARLPQAMGRVGDGEGLREFVRQRREKLRLDVDVGHPLVWYARWIAMEFPDAKFIATVRALHPWVNSVVDHNRNRGEPQPHWNYRNVYYGPWEQQHYRTGGRSVVAYLRYWNQHYAHLLEAVPPDRILFVPTDALSERLDQIAMFVGVKRLKMRAAYLNYAPHKHRAVRLDRAFLSAVYRECTSTINALQQRPELRGWGVI